MNFKLFFVFLVAQFIFWCTALSQGSFEISGSINTKFNDWTVRLGGRLDSNYTILETRIKEGKFYLSGLINEKYIPIHLAITNLNQTFYVDFFITDTKMKINIEELSDSLNKIFYTNVPFVNLQKSYDNFIRNSEDSVRILYNYKRSMKNLPLTAVDSIESLYKEKKKDLLNRRIKFIKANYNSYFSLFQFNKYVLNTPLLKTNDIFSIYSGFSNELKLTPEGKFASTSLKKKNLLSIDNVMPDFSFKTNLGKKYNLSQFNGNRYILLCFWASWCKPCIKNIPMLVEMNKEYSAKLQLISISIDNNKENWLSALEKFKMPWLQSCDISEFIEKRIRSIYQINWIPQYFLIDKHGKLIYQNFQFHDNDSYSGLKEILTEIR